MKHRSPHTTIRDLTRDDAAALLSYYQSRPDWIVEWFDPFPATNKHEIDRHLAAACSGNTVSLGLFTSGGRIVGHAFVRRLNSVRPGFGIGLAESAHGLGLGRKLMRAALDEADRRETPRIALSVFKANLRARRLYRSFGFVNMGEHDCREPGDSIIMERLRGGGTGGSMHRALLQLFGGLRPDRAVWTADITYWMQGRKHDGSADPAWDTADGYLQLHRELGVMPYYDYGNFWTGKTVYDATVTLHREERDGRIVRLLKTPRGTLSEESVFLPDSSCYATARHFVENEADLDTMLYALQHRELAPDNLEDYSERRRLWSEYDGLPCLGLPRSPLPALVYEWAGLENAVMLMLDCADKVGEALNLMEQQEAPVLDAVCRRCPPLVHFPDNLSSDNLTGYYDEHMRERHLARLDRLHAVGIRAAIHLDGTVRGLLPKLADAGFDAVEALTPKPAGDLSVEEIDELVAGRDTILWGGVPGAMFAGSYRSPAMEEHVRHVLQTWGHRRFVLGVADQVPPDGDIELCRGIADIVEERSERRG